MGDSSVFMDQDVIPTDKFLQKEIGKSYSLWIALRKYVTMRYPESKEEWKFSGAKSGWSYRMKDSRRVLIYLLPRDNFFKVAFVFGHKATEAILKSDVSPEIKTELQSAKVYAEGRGIRLTVNTTQHLEDVKFLIDTKLQN